MTVSSTALSRLTEQIEAGTDALVTGAPTASRRLMEEAALRLAEVRRVIRVASPVGELSLSHLIAQLSGRHDFEGQDDSVLELGFRRLAVPEAPGQRTVLLLQAPHGIGRSALRYLQHTAQSAPDLTLAMLAGPALETLLEEPGFTALRTRLLAEAAIDVSETPAETPAPAVTTAPVLPDAIATTPVALLPSAMRAPEPLLAPASSRLAVPSLRRRRSALLWTVSAIGVAAVFMVLAWVGHTSPAIQAGLQRLRLTMPVVTAVLSPPSAADTAGPSPAVPAEPSALAPAAAPAAAAPGGSATKLATAPAALLPSAQPPRAAVSRPAMATATPAEPASTPAAGAAAELRTAAVAAMPEPPLPPATKPDRATRVRRAEPRPRDTAQQAGRRTYWPPTDLQQPEAARYAWDRPEPQPESEPPSSWALRRDVRRSEGAYLGTYAADPYGTRVFRYDP